MFAEELSGSASRKRQEQARERRRKLKDEQRRRASAQKSSSGNTPSEKSTTVVPHDSTVASQVTGKGAFTTHPKPSSALTADSSGKTSSAVAITLERRRARQEHQHQQRCAIVIQSLYRAYKSNCALLKKERLILKGHLADLVSLKNLLQKAGNVTEYVPPPATVSTIVRRLLFATRAIKAEEFRVQGKEDAEFIKQVIRCLLLPGMMAKDGHLEPLLPWLASSEGRLRLLRLLRLSLIVATTRGVSQETLSSVDMFLRQALGVNASGCDEIVRWCRGLLLQARATESSHQNGLSMDLIQVVRHHLLFRTGHSNPIPPSAATKREKCISQAERDHADILFQLLLDVVLHTHSKVQAQELQCRFVAEIFTVPLLTWKVSAVSVSRLLVVASPNTLVCKTASSLRPLVLTSMLATFVEQHKLVLSGGEIGSVLPQLDIRQTPVTNVQVMLANLVQIGRICPPINGSDPTAVDYKAGALFFDFLATLVDKVPLGTLSSRQTAVEWISDGGAHHSPIVLSPVIIDQCKLLLVDSYVRDLFNAAIDSDALCTDRVLHKRNDRDLKDEKDLAYVGTASATNLAAKEARMDRSKGFWQSSKWGRLVGKMLTGDGSNKKAGSQLNGPGQLLNTSAVARELAHGKGQASRHLALASDDGLRSKKAAPVANPTATYTPEFLVALSRMYGIILARWGGGGSDLIKRSAGTMGTPQDTAKGNKETATSVADPCTLSLLNTICFSTKTVATTWSIIQSDKSAVAEVASITAEEESVPVRSTHILPSFGTTPGSGRAGSDVGVVLLYIFVCSLSHQLIITDDVEIHDLEQPLPIHQIRRCIRLLKKLLYRACYVDARGEVSVANYFGLSLISSSSKTMRDLYDRSSRRPLCVPKVWIVDDLLDKEIRRCSSHEEYVSLLSNPVLKVCPFLVSFKRRLKLFERIVSTNRLKVQGSAELFSQKPGIPVRIIRGRVLEDGLMTLNKLGRNLRQRIIVQYVNEAGARETGVDAGGLFKEFWTDLSAVAFNPNYALFRETEGAGNCLYPNPSSSAAHGPDHIILFEFLGRILGKALYEGITIHPQFAHFFLSFLRGDYNFLHMLPDLSTMDPQLYMNLMFLKTYDGDARDLCLSFTVATDDFGNNVEVPLIPNGDDIEVTNENKQRYIGLVAKHRVCDRLREQSEAFTSGLWDVIDRSWICLFNEPELQVLISGSSDGSIDIADMRSNTRYVGGYTGLDRTVNRFWKVVSSFSSKQQADLLRFVTSCERPPPLGFASMNPPFTIQRVGILRDGDKLPTASTCFNTLKLPTYSSERVLRERLLYAIESGAGFELT